MDFILNFSETDYYIEVDGKGMIRLSKGSLFFLFCTICKSCLHTLPSLLEIDIPWLHTKNQRKECRKEGRTEGGKGKEEASKEEKIMKK